MREAFAADVGHLGGAAANSRNGNATQGPGNKKTSSGKLRPLGNRGALKKLRMNLF